MSWSLEGGAVPAWDRAVATEGLSGNKNLRRKTCSLSVRLSVQWMLWWPWLATLPSGTTGLRGDYQLDKDLAVPYYHQPAPEVLTSQLAS